MFPSGCQNKAIEVLPVEQVKWEKLNPARGSKSPKGTLWGIALVVPQLDFWQNSLRVFPLLLMCTTSPYRGIVIEALIHNDGPKAATLWMPKLSYWTQPAGPHITSAKGKRNIALVEIDHGLT